MNLSDLQDTYGVHSSISADVTDSPDSLHSSNFLTLFFKVVISMYSSNDNASW